VMTATPAAWLRNASLKSAAGRPAIRSAAGCASATSAARCCAASLPSWLMPLLPRGRLAPPTTPASPLPGISPTEVSSCDGRITTLRRRLARLGARRFNEPVHRPWSRLAAAAAGLAVAIAAAVADPAGAAEAAEATEVHGVVTVAGAPVPGIRVGTWSLARGTVATAVTDVEGRFALRSPSDVPVVAFAGRTPSAAKAVFAAGQEHLVRGVVGAAAPTGTPSALQQTVARALPARLGGGQPLRFALQRAGRFTASTGELGASADVTGAIAIQHDTGLYGPEYRATAEGVVTSGWLVPGRYRLLWNPKPDVLPARTWVTVRAGETVIAQPPAFAVATTVRIAVTSGGAPVGAGVPAVQRIGDDTASVPPTDTTGTVVLHGVAPGTHVFTVGRYFDDPDEGLEGPPSSDDLLPRTVAVEVKAGEATAAATVDLMPASRLTGTVRVPRGTGLSVVVEDARGNVVRRAAADGATGTFSAGGLTAGRYSVIAIDLDRHRYAQRDVVLPVAKPGSAPTAIVDPLVPTIDQPVLRGTVRGATGGAVRLRSAPVQGAVLVTQSATIGAKGGYRLRSIPGRFTPVVEADGRVAREAASRLVTVSGTKDLVPGARTAAVVARFAVDGRVVPAEVQANRGATELSLVRAADGRSVARGAAPGRYRWTRVLAPLPAADGPWHYAAPRGGFVLRAGVTARLGSLALMIRG
jgi:hypothetical protein